MGNMPAAISNETSMDVSGMTYDPLVKLFFHSTRQVPCTDYSSIHENKLSSSEVDRFGKTTLEEYFDESWNVDHDLTLRFMFYLRDCRNGKGERKLFRALVRHLCATGRMDYVKNNMHLIPDFGSWKDILLCFLGTPLEDSAITLIANQLMTDVQSDIPSYCAKYAPREKGPFDKQHKAAEKVARKLGVPLSVYRKKYLTPLKAKLHLVEREMCAGKWHDIDYSQVPFIALFKYEQAFARHDGGRFVQRLPPRSLSLTEIISVAMENAYNSTIEDEWSKIFTDIAASWPRKLTVIPILDTSSLSPEALAYGILCARLSPSERFGNSFFSCNPQTGLYKLGATLQDAVDDVFRADNRSKVDMSRIYRRILQMNVTGQISTEEAPRALLLISDDDFTYDSSDIWNRYQDKGYEPPILLQWRMSRSLPTVEHRPDRIIIDGNHELITSALFRGYVPNFACSITNILLGPRYSDVESAT